jgi:putative phosphonate metabolism protein
MQGKSRYAIYFAPREDSNWWRFGCAWLGRDPISGCAQAQPMVPGIPAGQIADFTAAPRHYGFHATLKAPFALAEGASAEDVYRTAAVVARQRQPLELGVLMLQSMGHFLALRPADPPSGLARLAEDCVRSFDALRAPAAGAELTRRRQAALTPQHEALLARWGYPHVMDEWRFHMTLTRDLSDSESVSLFPWLLSRVRQLHAEPLAVDAICVFEQSVPAAPFRLTHHFGFDGTTTDYCDERLVREPAGTATDAAATQRGL